MTIGNCGCKVCGLRGYSKNVVTRNVFPDFGKRYWLQIADRCVTARYNEEKKTYLFGANAEISDPASQSGYRPATLAEFLIKYLKQPEAQLEDLKILLCVHQWVQDEGTETA